MAENFELLETGQIEIMHEQVHNRTGGDDDCFNLRSQHDNLAAELVKRGIVHDTEIICPESELEQKAPNYRHGFTDDICTNCAFGQLFPFCNLYKADYVKDYTCDSFRYFEVLELEPPHGFLMAQEKQTAIASNKLLDYEKLYLIISNGEAFGIAEFDQPAQIKTKEFDNEKWLNQHRVTSRERRQWWPDTESFYVYRLKSWHPYGGVKLYENGKVIDEPKLTAKQWKLVSAAKELPKQILLLENALNVTTDYKFITSDEVRELFAKPLTFKIDEILKATFEVDKLNYKSKSSGELIPLYSLALVRNPRMRVSKKSLKTAKKEAIEIEIKQEDEIMPFGIIRREDEYCVINTETEEVQACHETEEEAEAQLAALRINVEAEEGEGAHHTDKPRKRKPKKKEISIGTITPVSEVDIKQFEKAKKEPFMKRLRLAAKNILDIITLAETEEKEAKTELLNSDYGVAQKEVNGELWHFTWSTNAFEDREKEIFSTNSLKRYVDQATEKQDKGFFNLWHITNTDFAKKKWQMVIGRFLVEAGPYLEDNKGQAAKEFFSQHADGHPELAPEGWGCSPEFKYLPEERIKGVYENIWITRTSTLPRFAAANMWTETSQLTRLKMAITDYNEDQIKAAVEVFKDEDFVKSLIQEGENKTAELEAANVAHKEKKEDGPQEIQLNMEELAAEVGKQFSANLVPMAEAIATMATELKELREWKDKQDKKQGIKDKTEVPRYVFEWKRASEQDETIVTEDDGLKNKKPKETKTKDSDPWSQMFNK
jgi:hypothetical protein